MNISIFGLGYVGVVTAACLARNGHTIIGVDVAREKVDLVNTGRSPIVEDEIDELVREGVASGKLRAITDTFEAVAATELAIVCVGTPSREDGSLETCYIETVTRQIGEALRGRKRDFCVVIRSTVIPGTVRSLIIPLLEQSSGRQLGSGIEVMFHPEFLREGTSVKDFYNPPKIIVGERVPGTGRVLMDLYEGIEAPRHYPTIEVAEMLKYSDNIFHAVKVTFANEIGQLCHRYGIDSREVMGIFCTDTKLNIAPSYLKPGFAFGGSCLPKDLRALLALARSCNVSVPMLENVLSSNRSQVERVLRLVIASKPHKIGLLGLAFKPGTDDLRESPLVELAERLLGKGYTLRICDKSVQINRLIGKNKAYIDQHLPHLARLMGNHRCELDECDTILIGHAHEDSQIEKWLRAGIRVFDLTGANRFPETENYSSIV
jgi:GDP-mannose 6-dehydrogenase